MNSLTLRRRERNRWALSAGLLLVAIVTGVLGLGSAFAEGSNATCSVVVDASNETAEWQWSGVVAGAAVVGYVVDGAGTNLTVDTAAPDDVMGYGPSGTWASTAPVALGATGFGIWVDPALGGGALTCTSVGGDTDTGTGGETTTTLTDTTTTPADTSTTTPAETTTTVVETTTTVPETTTSTTPPPSAPHLTATARLDCDALVVVVLVTNDGDTDGTADVVIDRVPTALAVPAGQTVEQRIPVATGQAVSVVVRTPDGTTLTELSAATPCEDVPADIDATAVVDCNADQVVVVVSNRGGRAESVRVSVNGADIDLVVQPGAAIEHVEPIGPGDDVEVSVTTPGGRVVLSEQWSGVCEEPRADLTASLTVDCTTDELVITIRNAGTIAGLATYDVNGQTATVAVAPGATEVVTLAIDGTAALDVAVWAGDTSLAREVRPVACDSPEPDLDAVAAIDCGSETVTVTVFNNGDAAGSVVVTVDGRARELVVGAGETVLAQERVTVGHDVPVLVTAGGATILDQLLDGNCGEQEPILTAVAVVDCNTGRVVASIRNEGDRAASVDITFNGQDSIVEVDPGATMEWSRPVAAGADVELRISYRNEVLVSLDQSDVCRPEGPSITADIAVDCASHVLVVSIVNTGRQPDVATVRINGEPTEVTVPAGSQVVRTVPVTEDVAVTASVVVGDTVVRSVTLTVDCTPGVQSPQPSASIARSCDRSDAGVVLVNSGTAPATFTVTVNGAPRTEVVDAGQTRTISVALVEDTRYEIVVTAGSTTTLASSVFVHDCVNVLDQGRSVPPTATGSGYQSYNLAHTGIDVATLVVAGVATVLAGAVALSAARLRRQALAG